MTIEYWKDWNLGTSSEVFNEELPQRLTNYHIIPHDEEFMIETTFESIRVAQLNIIESEGGSENGDGFCSLIKIIYLCNIRELLSYFIELITIIYTIFRLLMGFISSRPMTFPSNIFSINPQNKVNLYSYHYTKNTINIQLQMLQGQLWFNLPLKSVL